jgi:nicotinamide-nucleotide amidase
VNAPEEPGVIERAEIIAVGTELVSSSRAETNSIFLTAALNELGIEVVAKAVVRDDVDDLAAALEESLRRSHLVVLTGGLGPTDDDLTRQAVARVLGKPLVEDPVIVERIRQRFASRGWTMPEINRRQALVIGGADVLENTVGTAPGQWLRATGVPGGASCAGRLVVLLPGPPREMQPMFHTAVFPRLRGLSGEFRLFRRIVSTSGRAESSVEEKVRPFYERWRQQPLPVAATILAASGQVDLHLSTRSADATAAAAALDRAVQDLRDRLGDDVFSTTGDSLEAVIAALLTAGGWRVALAESCTAGAVTARLVNVPGSSAWLERAVVAYSNASKTEMLGVPARLIAEQGAVSEPVALAMAEGIRASAGTEVGVGVTGIAGPGGGSPEKPVGTVVVAVVGPGAAARVRTVWLPGARAQIRASTCQLALDALRRQLQAAGAE